MRLPKELIPIVLVFAVLITVNVFRKRNAPARSTQAAGAKYASYSTEERGTKAFYLLLGKLGYNPKRIRVPHFTGMRSGGLAVILAPDQPSIDSSDSKRLLEWLRQGSILLLAPSRYSDQLTEALGIQLHRGRPLESSIAPLAFTDLTAGVQRLVVRSGDRVMTERSGAIQHFGDSAGGVVISLQEGQGTAIILSDPYLMTNAGLSEGDNLDLLVNILFSYAANTKAVYFDEYHHGFERRPGILHLLRSPVLGFALLQVAAAVVLLMYSRGRRFGQPKPVLKEAHRSSVEYVTSLAGIYQAARSSDLVMSDLYERLLPRGRMPSRTSGALKGAKPLHSMSNPSSSGTIRELMDELEQKMKYGKISERDLIDLSRRMELTRHP